jgi:cysteine desulfurase
MTRSTPVYMDNQATTPLDPRVLDVMLPFLRDHFGNAASASHSFGWDAKEAVDSARAEIAAAIGARPREIVFTSGATESNNLALRGVAEQPRRNGNHIVSVSTEHRAVLDPLARLARHGFEVTLLPVEKQGGHDAGRVSPDAVAAAIRDDTVLVTVMLANNEIGVIQPLAELGTICKERGVLLHTDATQAVGKIPVDVEQMQVDLMSFSAHKMYGPKGVGALYVRRRAPHVRIVPQIDGGGHEQGLRSGTLNVPGIVGLAAALRLCLEEMDSESQRLMELRQRLFRGICDEVPDVVLCGPPLDEPHLRLPGNLNLAFPLVDGEALMLSMRDVAVSSGSACTSASPEPSHVLRALGLGDDLMRGSLRFGLGRFNTQQDVDFAVQRVTAAVDRLRKMSSLSG